MHCLKNKFRPSYLNVLSLYIQKNKAFYPVLHYMYYSSVCFKKRFYFACIIFYLCYYESIGTKSESLPHDIL